MVETEPMDINLMFDDSSMLSRGCLSTTLSEFHSLKPDDADHAGGDAYGYIGRMKHGKAKKLPQKRRVQREAEKKKRPAGHPPQRGIGGAQRGQHGAGP